MQEVGIPVPDGDVFMILLYGFCSVCRLNEGEFYVQFCYDLDGLPLKQRETAPLQRLLQCTELDHSSIEDVRELILQRKCCLQIQSCGGKCN